jgi:hypothetical protein
MYGRSRMKASRNERAANHLAQVTTISMIARLNAQFHARNIIGQRDARGWIMGKDAQLNHTNNAQCSPYVT